MESATVAIAATPADVFRNELIRHGHLLPTGVDGLYGRGEAFERVIAAVDTMVGRLAGDDRVEVLRFPPAMSRAGFEASGYFRNFPQLTAGISCFCGDDSAHRRALACTPAEGGWASHMQPADVMLTPASCYPVYPIVAARGRLPAEGWLVDSSSYCFRREPSVDPVRMQMFRQREQVCFGTPDRIRAFQSRWMDRAMAMFAALHLPAATDIANDPFFGRAAPLMRDGQRSQRLKFEILVPISDPDRPNACGSFNYHVTHFAEAYGIHAADGELAHTGCAGFGLERIVLALLRHHGMDPARWPGPVRAALSP